MFNIQTIFNKYHDKIDHLDLELIISHVIKKPREFVLAHPEYPLSKNRALVIEKFIQRRINHKPLAYILGNKEFYGLNFKVNKIVLIPRPETEMLVESVLWNIKHRTWNKNSLIIADVGTGSGNIITSIAHHIEHGTWNKKQKIDNIKYLATDISKTALKIAKYNAKKNKVSKKIKFLQGNLLKPFFEYLKFYVLRDTCYVTIIANLPYLSKNIYSKTSPDIKKFEPKSALLSRNKGLAHYEKLLRQLKKYVTCYALRATCFIEFSPEQKISLKKMIKKYFPNAKIRFQKDLARKWRMAYFNI